MNCFTTSNRITAPAVALDVLRTAGGNGRGTWVLGWGCYRWRWRLSSASFFNPVLSLPENNNRSETLELLSNQALSFSFLIETKICSQKPKSKAPKGFQALVSPKVTEQG